MAQGNTIQEVLVTFTQPGKTKIITQGQPAMNKHKAETHQEVILQGQPAMKQVTQGLAVQAMGIHVNQSRLTYQFGGVFLKNKTSFTLNAVVFAVRNGIAPF